jgi:hypothetical protein
MREMFTEASSLTVEQQKVKIETTLDDWIEQQTFGQIDDVTVMGIRL